MRALKTRSVFIIMLTLLIVAIQGCASTRKNPWAEKRKKASHVNTTQLGRNRYYFSVNYQKKLQRSLKK